MKLFHNDELISVIEEELLHELYENGVTIGRNKCLFKSVGKSELFEIGNSLTNPFCEKIENDEIDSDDLIKSNAT